MIAPRTRLVALAFALVLPTIVTLAYFVLLADQPLGRVAYVIGKSVQFAFPLFWVVIVLRERLRITASLRGVPTGLAFGLFVGGTMLALYFLLLKPAGFFVGPDEAVRQKIVQLKLDSLWLFTAAAVFYSLGHSFLEEYYWRWFVFGRLRELMPLTPAIVVSSLGFMAHHVILLAVYFGAASPVTYVFSLGVAVGGAVWAWLYDWSGSLFGPWLSHLLVDAAIFVVGFELVYPLLI